MHTQQLTDPPLYLSFLFIFFFFVTSLLKVLLWLYKTKPMFCLIIETPNFIFNLFANQVVAHVTES